MRSLREMDAGARRSNGYAIVETRPIRGFLVFRWNARSTSQAVKRTTRGAKARRRNFSVCHVTLIESRTATGGCEPWRCVLRLRPLSPEAFMSLPVRRRVPMLSYWSGGACRLALLGVMVSPVAAQGAAPLPVGETQGFEGTWGSF